MNAKINGLMARTVVLLSFWASLLSAQPYHFAGGTGESNDPYQIATAEQLISIGSDANLLDKHFILLNDIDLDPNLPGSRIFTKAVIAPDAYRSLDIYRGWFTGTFDGRGHRIRNLIILDSRASKLALFGGVGKEGVVTDLGVDHAQVVGQKGFPCSYGAFVAENMGRLVRCSAEAHVSGPTWVGVLVGDNRGQIIECWSAGEAVGCSGIGGLVGYNSLGVILRSHAISRVLAAEGAEYGYECYGGLVGENYGGLIVDCYATGDVSARAGINFGGLVGESGSRGLIVNSYATGIVSIKVDGGCLGGLVGNVTGASIYDCYATGDVSGGDGTISLGGLVGRTEGGITDSYCTGRVSAGKDSRYLGGIVGYRDGAEIKACFWDVQTSGLSESAGGTGLTTAQMQDIAMFRTAGWDWVDEQDNGTADLWSIPERGGYPLLTVHSAVFESHKLEGRGTADDPYRIATAEDLGAVNHCDLGACYRFEADISLARIAWHKAPIQYFDGQLDGAGKVVTGLKVHGDTFLGLFGGLGRHASVVTLGIHDANITGRCSLGILAGENMGRIMACRVDGSVIGNTDVACLTGWNEGTISDSYAIGDIMATDTWCAGGLTGRCPSAVERCYAAVNITFTQGKYWPVNVVGGLVGSNDWDTLGEVHDSYFLVDTDGGGPDNHLGVALTGSQMKQQASFVDWDFDKTWTICEGKDYPRLWWEDLPCEK